MGRAQGKLAATAARDIAPRGSSPAAAPPTLSSLQPPEMTIEQLTSAINNRLHALEKDDTWNKFTWTDGRGTTRDGTHFYQAHAWVAPGQKIRVSYVSYQNTSTLERGQAEDYLSWLRAGNRGSHHQAGKTIRPTRRDMESEATRVAYHVRYADPVRSAVFIPEDAPLTAPAAEVAEGDKVYVSSQWRNVEAVGSYDPPLPEDIQALGAKVRDATLRGDYQKVAAEARKMASMAEQMTADRGQEVHLRLAGGKTMYFTADCALGIKRGK